jgi:hypothetical protein
MDAKYLLKVMSPKNVRASRSSFEHEADALLFTGDRVG